MPHIPGRAIARCMLATAAATGAFAAVIAVAAAQLDERIEWRLAPAARYSADVTMTHIIANDLNGVYKKLAGSKADPVTIVEERTIVVSTGANGALTTDVADTRRYGGDHPKDSTVMHRSAKYAATMTASGKRSPTGEPLVDPGDGALAELPANPIAVGQSWSFSRQVLVDRDLGHGTMTYTDTLTRVDSREGHQLAVIAVKGAGRVDVAQDLKAKGFETADMTLAGTAEFDLTSGLLAKQHYTAHAQWNTHVLWVHIGLIFDDVYDAAPWSLKEH